MTEAFFRQWECMAQPIETVCVGTIGSLYGTGCGSGVNLYLFLALKHVGEGGEDGCCHRSARLGEKRRTHGIPPEVCREL